MAKVLITGWPPMDGSGMFAAARRAPGVLLLVAAAAWIAVGPSTPTRRYPQRASALFGDPVW
jgi:hypothetical protein